MPVCFQLFKKGQTEPSVFFDVDNELRAHFKDQVSDPRDPDKFYFCDWYGNIGSLLAMGRSFDHIINEVGYTECTVEIAKYLEEHYTTTNWRSHR